jgi:hypothetical protein
MNPHSWSIWRHKRTGRYYTVIAIANQHADADRRDEYPVTVVHQDNVDGHIWSRPERRWHESFEMPGGQYDAI